MNRNKISDSRDKEIEKEQLYNEDDEGVIIEPFDPKAVVLVECPETYRMPRPSHTARPGAGIGRFVRLHNVVICSRSALLQ